MRKTSLLALSLALVVTVAPAAMAKKKVIKPKKTPVKTAKTVVKPITVAQLTSKVMLAGGGSASVDSVKSMIITGVRRVPKSGVTMPFELYYKAPNMLLFVGQMSEIGNMTMGFDGETGWSNDAIFGLRDIVGGELDMFKQQWIPGAQTSWKEYKTISIAGTKKIGTDMAYKVELVPSSGYAKTEYIDPKTFLPLGYERDIMLPVGTIPVDVMFRDWRVIDGVSIPFESDVTMVTGDKLAEKAATDNALTKTEVGDALTELVIGNTVIELIDVKFNVDIDDGIFQKPIAEATPGVIIHPQ